MAHTGAIRLGDITKTTFLDHLRWHKAQGRGDYTIRNVITTIRMVFKWAIDNGYFTGANPTEGIKKSDYYKPNAQDGERIVVHSFEDMKKLLDVARERGKRDVLLTIILCGFQGLRRNECANFRLEWCERGKRPMIRIREFTLADGYTFKLKTHERHDIPMTKLLLEELPDETEGFLFKPRRVVNGNGRYRVDQVKGLRECLKAAGLPTVKAYQNLRIAFGNMHFRNNKMTLDEIAQWMGNSAATLKRWYIGDAEYTSKIDLM